MKDEVDIAPADSTPLLTALVINLDQDTARLAHMEAQCARVGLKLRRWPAVLGAALPLALAPLFAHPSSGDAWKLSAGEIGCYASHITIWQAIVDERLGAMALVMEDDLRLDDDFLPAVKSAVTTAAPGWDLIRLSNFPRRAFMPIADLGRGYSLVHFTRVPISCGAYLISRAGAAKLLASYSRTLPVDEDCRRVWRFGLNTLGVVPPPATPGVLKSTIAMLGGRRRRTRDWKDFRLAITDRLGSVRTNWAVLGGCGWLLSQGINVADTVLKRTRVGTILEKAAPMLARVRGRRGFVP